jgi:multicomponent K+:H+ antiporter subunit A
MALVITGAAASPAAGGVLIGPHRRQLRSRRVLAAGDAIRAHALHLPALVLILLGALTKSAQFPFHFWLPQRHGGADAGVGLPALGDDGEGRRVPAGAAVAGAGRHRMVLAGRRRRHGTLVLGAYFAMFQNDLKGLLAYSTISHLGLITCCSGLGSAAGGRGRGVPHHEPRDLQGLAVHGAGIIDHETGTRDMRRLSGLFHYMPITATLAMVASAAMAGVPLLNGFLSKEMFFAEAIETCRASRTSRRSGCACPACSWCWPASWSASSRRRRSVPTF